MRIFWTTGSERRVFRAEPGGGEVEKWDGRVFQLRRCWASTDAFELEGTRSYV